MTPISRRLEVRFAMPSDPRYLPVVRGAVGPLAAAIGWDDSDCLAITLAVDEALSNVIRHAYHNRPDGLIELECRESENGLEIAMLDTGEAPDLSNICARDPDGDQPGGLGTHIIRKVMDSVAYEPSPEGNRFVARKTLPGENAVKISIRDVGKAKVVEVEGDVDLGSSPAFRHTLLDALPLAQTVALDLGAIRYIDSSGIATLIEVLKRSQRLNMNFVLFGLSPAVQEVFRLTHVFRLFAIFQTEQEALGTP